MKRVGIVQVDGCVRHVRKILWVQSIVNENPHKDVSLPHDYDPDSLQNAEADIRSRLAGQPVDLEVQRAISNLYRAATVISRSAEREILAPSKLSWSAFIVLWVLWVWGEMDSSRLAAEVGLTPGTLTGVRNNLESQGWVQSRRDADDGRRVQVSLTPSGDTMFEELYPRFNAWSSEMLGGLDTESTTDLAELLQAVIVQPARNSATS